MGLISCSMHSKPPLQPQDLASSFAVSLHGVDDAVTRWYAARGFRPLIEGDPKRSMYVRMSEVEATLHEWSHLK